MATPLPSLAEFLRQNKQQFLQDLEAKNADKWTVVMGNEAGDLDTIASSVAYSYLATNLQRTPTVALVQTRHTDLYLRKENLFALGFSNLDSTGADLLCIDDISDSHPLNTSFSKYVLVDHNTLEDAFEGGTGKVVGIIDHHTDEKKYPDAVFREIETAGSCTSLVARHFQNGWTAEAGVSPDVATLLLTGVTIDTRGLSNDDVKPVDENSARFLYANSKLAQQGSFQGKRSLKDLDETLDDKKDDVGDLSTNDLLRRDYKDFDTSNKLTVGLASVPLRLEAWAERDKDQGKNFFDEVEAYFAKHNLSVLGILTTKKKRELLFLTNKDTVPADMEKRLFDGLKNNKIPPDNVKTLDLKETDKLGKPNHPEHTKVWDQGNKEGSRKVIAPMVKSLLEG
ncbi:Exopolyphosphatase [Tulasnella sp. 408]|nr:Exopolyphosphatase [Tulasnella sp. 408]